MKLSLTIPLLSSLAPWTSPPQLDRRASNELPVTPAAAGAHTKVAEGGVYFSFYAISNSTFYVSNVVFVPGLDELWRRHRSEARAFDERVDLLRRRFLRTIEQEHGETDFRATGAFDESVLLPYNVKSGAMEPTAKRESDMEDLVAEKKRQNGQSRRIVTITL